MQINTVDTVLTVHKAANFVKAILAVKKKGCYIFQLFEELKVTGHYILFSCLERNK